MLLHEKDALRSITKQLRKIFSDYKGRQIIRDGKKVQDPVL